MMMIIIIIIIMNMQNKLYTLQFFSPPNDQICNQSPSSDHGTHRFPGAHEFCQTQISQNLPNYRKKTELMEDSKLKEKRDFLPHGQPPIHKLSMTSMVLNISIGQLGLAA